MDIDFQEQIPIIALEIVCSECGGRKENQWYCNVCDGTGFALTEVGEALYSFLTRVRGRQKWRQERNEIKL
jgi:hypothetical protein